MQLWNLLLFRLLQLTRPVAAIVLLRFLNVDLATSYAALLSAYVLTLEVYNVLSPTDRLYLPESNGAELRAILRQRMRAAPFIVLGATAVLIEGLHLSVLDAVLLSVAASVNAHAVSFTSYLHGRVTGTRLAVAEIASWVLTCATVGILLGGFSLLAAFLLYCSEQCVRALIFASGFTTGAKRWLRGFPWRSRATEGGPPAGIFGEGVTVTVANHIYRLPFLMQGGLVDPVFIIAAQGSAATYNLMMSVTSKYRLPRLPSASFAVTAIIACLVLAAGGITSPPVRITLQTLLLCMLAVLHGTQMTQLVGNQGIAAYRPSRLVILIGLGIVSIAGLAIHPAVFMASPAVLSLATHLASMKRND